MDDERPVLERYLEAFDPDLEDGLARTLGRGRRRQRYRRTAVGAVALVVAVGAGLGLWLAFTPVHRATRSVESPTPPLVTPSAPLVRRLSVRPVLRPVPPGSCIWW
ncbi:MAG TPA: hypothetical protein DIU14_01630 [Actinobacteria bacterium]|jgi:hypothetical protein|nr:hypothetical protein [Actinomycetota bacterium]